MNQASRTWLSGRRSKSAKSVSSWILVPFLLTLLILPLGCGSSGSGKLPEPLPGVGVSSPPFDAAKGEGNLLNQQLMVTYPTQDPGWPTSSDTSYLDTFYRLTICPAGLDSTSSGASTNYCTQNQASLDTPQFGNFNLSQDPIGKNALGIGMIDAIKIDYTAINVDQAAVTVSGGILIPHLAPASIKGIVLYFHGTTVDRSNVPSNFGTSTNAGDSEGQVFAAIWASQGYVVVMPDYIGLGDDVAHVHPYVVYPMQNAQSGLAMVKAARSVLTTYGITGQLPLFTTGYSEGGAYSLEAAHMMQNNSGYATALNAILRKAVPLSGAFDLSGTMISYLFDNISPTNNNWYSLDPYESASSKPVLSANLALSFATYSGIGPANILADAFYNCGTILNYPICTGTLDNVYYAPNTTDGIVAFVALLQAEQTNWGVLTDNAVTPLLTQAYADGLMQRNSNNPLYQQLVVADTYPFVPTFPVTLVSLSQDSVVTRKNTDVAFAYFTQQNPQGSYSEQLIANSNFEVYYGVDTEVDHVTEVPFASVLILNEFNTAP